MHTPTEEQRALVRKMYGLGAPQEFIARVLGIDPKTLRLHYEFDLANGTDQANMDMAGSLFKNGMEGNVAAQIFWMKTRARWKEPVDEDETDTEIRIVGGLPE